MLLIPWPIGGCIVGGKVPGCPSPPTQPGTDLEPLVPLGPAVSPASVGVCGLPVLCHQSQPPPCPLSPGGAGGPWGQPQAWVVEELQEGPEAGRGRKILDLLVILPHQSTLPTYLASPHLGIPSWNHPLWEQSPFPLLLPILGGWAGTLAAVVGGTLLS